MQSRCLNPCIISPAILLWLRVHISLVMFSFDVAISRKTLQISRKVASLPIWCAIDFSVEEFLRYMHMFVIEGWQDKKQLMDIIPWTTKDWTHLRSQWKAVLSQMHLGHSSEFEF